MDDWKEQELLERICALEKRIGELEKAVEQDHEFLGRDYLKTRGYT